jgi:YVTN family beta-propeller protein
MQMRKIRVQWTIVLMATAGVALETLSASPLLAAETAYRVVERLHLDGDVKWDYLSFDAVHQRLFVTRGDHVDVFDVAAKQVIGSIPDTHGVHGVALAPDLDRGYASNGQDNTVTVFDLASLTVLATVATGERPDAIVYDARTKRVFTGNAKGHSITAIDAVNYRVIGSIALTGKPEFAVVDGSGLLYINIEDKSQMVTVDTKNLNVTRYYDMSYACSNPSGLAIDTGNSRLFVTCHNDVMAVVDAFLGGRILDALPIGHSSDAAVYDIGVNLAFSSNDDGTLTVIGSKGPNHYQVMQTLATMPGARTMALDPATHKLYLVSAEIEPAITGSGAGEKESRRPRFKAGTFTLLVVSP